jgi:presenilin-like A22 family membrane protease
MVLMAKEMIEKKVILGFIVPKQLKFFKENLDKVKQGGNFMILGGGDVVFPGLLAVSVLPGGIFKALIVAVFSLTGSFFSYWLFATQKDKEPIPALPPVALFAVIGYFITLLF